MNKILSIIFLSAIFGSTLAGGKNRAQRKANNAHHQVQHALRYEVPTSYIQCGGFYDAAHKALKESNGKYNLNLKTEDLNKLTEEDCQWGMTSYDWFVFTYRNENEICKVYVVASVHNFIGDKTKARDYYYLNKEQTEQANKEHGGCVKIIEEPLEKVVTDLPNNEVIEEIEEDIEVDLSESDKDVPKKDSVEVVQHKDESNQTTDSLLETPHHKDEITSHNEETTAHKEETTTHNVVEKQHEEQEVENIIPEYTPKDKSVYTINPRVYGPGRIPLPFKPHTEGQERGRKELNEDEDEEEVNIEPLFADLDREAQKHHEHLLGGWEQCEESDKELVPRVFAMLIAQGVIHGVTVYQQNVVECRRQLVNGFNYDVEVHFNKRSCQLAFHKEREGELSELKSAPSFGRDIPKCVDILKQ